MPSLAQMSSSSSPWLPSRPSPPSRILQLSVVTPAGCGSAYRPWPPVLLLAGSHGCHPKEPAGPGGQAFCSHTPCVFSIQHRWLLGWGGGIHGAGAVGALGGAGTRAVPVQLVLRNVVPCPLWGEGESRLTSAPPSGRQALCQPLHRPPCSKPTAASEGGRHPWRFTDGETGPERSMGACQSGSGAVAVGCPVWGDLRPEPQPVLWEEAPGAGGLRQCPPPWLLPKKLPGLLT